MAGTIRVWDRASGRMIEEKVHGGAGVRLLYGTGPGRWLESALFSRRFVSRLLGAWYGSRASRLGIRGFVQSQGIRMDEFEPCRYRSFNDFFVRRFRQGAREFDRTVEAMPAFAEARYLAFDRVQPEDAVPVKGRAVSVPDVLAVPDGRSIDPGRLRGGPLLIARLCPADYHRYHYPDGGLTRASWTVHGRYHSVNPAALSAVGDVFLRNERRVAILESERFGQLAYVEIGALGVGRIVQGHDERERFACGDEKGMFLFGGSTVLLFGEPGAWRPSADLLDRTSAGVESLVRLGEPVAVRRTGS